MPPEENTPEQSRAEVFAEAADQLDSIIELATGYRRKLEAQGFAPEIAQAAAGKLILDIQTLAFRQ
jgi:hypothetical protein